MKIAELTSIDFLGIGFEFCTGLILWGEMLAKHTIFGDEFDPLDVVGLGHRVIYRTYPDTIAISSLFDHRDMLFLGAIGGVLF